MSDAAAAGFDAVRQAMQRFGEIPDAEWRLVSAESTERSLAKGEHLFEIGDAVESVYFVRQGLLRVYYVHDGVEHTRSFTFEGRLYTNSFSLLTGVPSHYAVEALEPTRLFVLHKSVMDEAYERHPCWDRIGRLHSQANFIAKERREMEMRTLSPEERYWRLVETEPRVLQRVPLYHIASYLGIAPETLSRIRGKR